LGSPAVSRFYRVLQGPPARGTSGTHRGTLGTPGYLTGVLTGTHRCSRTRGRALRRRCSRTARRARARRTRLVGDTVGGTESPGREYPVSTDGSTPEYPTMHPRLPLQRSRRCNTKRCRRRRATASAAEHPVSTPSTDGSTPSTGVSTPSTTVSTLITPASTTYNGVLWVLTWAL
jgi:hypothetical protein